MKGTLVWVVGAGGLLGSHVIKAISEYPQNNVLWNPEISGIHWQDPDLAYAEISALAESFSDSVRLMSSSWAVLWCAGSGVIGSEAWFLSQETSYLKHLFNALSEGLSGIPGKVILASSAGGVYGNNPEQPLTEISACQPISAYGRNKLAQEQFIQEWAAHQYNVSTLIARISNLYGPGQNLQKPQGLIAHISRSLLHGTPVHLYVPLDTL